MTDLEPERQIATKALGDVAIREQQVLQFPLGLLGFEQLHQYALLDSSQPPFFWLQSVEHRDIAFVVINPYLVQSDYQLNIDKTDLAVIGDPTAEDLLVFAILTIGATGEAATCNLQGPIVINRAERLAHQAISLDPRWHTKHRIGAE